MRNRHIALVVGGVLVFALIAVGLYPPIRDGFEDPPSSSASADRELPPLPPGPPRVKSVEALTERATLDDMIAHAPVVFIGRVAAIGGSEVVSPASPDEGFELTVHRTRFDVVEAMRGDTASVVDVAQFDVVEPVPFEIGASYLIFSETRQLGSLKLPYLVPYGYHQGVYEQLASELFGNERNGSIAIATLKERLRGSALSR